MATKKRGLLIKIISIVLLVVILFGAIAAILLLQTPQQLGRDQNLVGNYTVEELGFANVSYWNILKMFTSVAKTHNINKIAPNHYNESDGTAADEVFANTSIAFLKNPKYIMLFTVDALKSRSDPIVLTEKQLAYTVNSALNEFYQSPITDIAADLGIQAAEILQELAISVVEMSFYQQEEKTYLKIVTQIQLSDFVDEAKQQSLNLADVAYCTFVNEIAIPARSLSDVSIVYGELTKNEFVGVNVNDLDMDISEKALNALLSLIAQEDSLVLNADMVNTCVFTVVQLLCSHIGSIGTQATDGTPTFGISAVNFDEHTISFVPSL